MQFTCHSCQSHLFCTLSIQFHRLETRMTADINVILQLLQRQIAPVPPAYSTVSSSTLPTDSPGLYGTGTSVLHTMYPISPLQMDSRASMQVWQTVECCEISFRGTQSVCIVHIQGISKIVCYLILSKKNRVMTNKTVKKPILAALCLTQPSVIASL